MNETVRHLLVTGPPRVGKTTLIKKVLQSVNKNWMSGFITAEIREKGRRVGFRIETLDGKRGILSHIRGDGKYRVGKYVVDIPAFERVALPSTDPDSSGAQLIVIDEIGKMECFSLVFQETVRRIMNSRVHMLATVAVKGGGLIEEVKRRPDVKIFQVTQMNRDSLAVDIIRFIERLLQD